jgi:hypothetical protein
MADRNGSALRLVLSSADRLSDRAMLRGSSRANKPSGSVNASLVCVTRRDHRFLARAAIAAA